MFICSAILLQAWHDINLSTVCLVLHRRSYCAVGDAMFAELDEPGMVEYR